ncbi:hypothetical protein F4777DRAFT_555462 [Nemania sp. FL0916]|nr:hypothetical protein F4777DRAFT_555462 [Nemania sp. FL0916]
MKRGNILAEAFRFLLRSMVVLILHLFRSYPLWPPEPGRQAYLRRAEVEGGYEQRIDHIADDEFGNKDEKAHDREKKSANLLTLGSRSEVAESDEHDDQECQLCGIFVR